MRGRHVTSDICWEQVYLGLKFDLATGVQFTAVCLPSAVCQRWSKNNRGKSENNCQCSGNKRRENYSITFTYTAS